MTIVGLVHESYQFRVFSWARFHDVDVIGIYARDPSTALKIYWSKSSHFERIHGSWNVFFTLPDIQCSNV